jgi:hypothetical protein
MVDGLDREYIDQQTNWDRLRVRIKTRPEQRPTYAVMLACLFADRWVQVARLDDWDGCPHIDRTNPDGTIDKEWLPDAMDNKINARRTLSWMKQNWLRERQRYESQLEP